MRHALANLKVGSAPRRLGCGVSVLVKTTITQTKIKTCG